MKHQHVIFPGVQNVVKLHPKLISSAPELETQPTTVLLVPYFVALDHFSNVESGKIESPEEKKDAADQLSKLRTSKENLQREYRRIKVAADQLLLHKHGLTELRENVKARMSYLRQGIDRLSTQINQWIETLADIGFSNFLKIRGDNDQPPNTDAIKFNNGQTKELPIRQSPILNNTWIVDPSLPPNTETATLKCEVSVIKNWKGKGEDKLSFELASDSSSRRFARIEILYFEANWDLLANLPWSLIDQLQGTEQLPTDYYLGCLCKELMFGKLIRESMPKTVPINKGTSPGDVFLHLVEYALRRFISSGRKFLNTPTIYSLEIIAQDLKKQATLYIDECADTLPHYRPYQKLEPRMDIIADSLVDLIEADVVARRNYVSPTDMLSDVAILIKQQISEQTNATASDIFGLWKGNHKSGLTKEIGRVQTELDSAIAKGDITEITNLRSAIAKLCKNESEVKSLHLQSNERRLISNLILLPDDLKSWQADFDSYFEKRRVKEWSQIQSHLELGVAVHDFYRLKHECFSNHWKSEWTHQDCRAFLQAIDWMACSTSALTHFTVFPPSVRIEKRGKLVRGNITHVWQQCKQIASTSESLVDTQLLREAMTGNIQRFKPYISIDPAVLVVEAYRAELGEEPADNGSLPLPTLEVD
jgi:hypothetical protein